jgi:CheY-like chemotaxis protein
VTRDVLCAVTAVDSGKRALELLGSVCVIFLNLNLLLPFRLCASVLHVLPITFVLGLQEANVSMIITDYWMPEMTGYELLKKVKVKLHDTMQPFLLVKIHNQSYYMYAEIFRSYLFLFETIDDVNVLHACRSRPSSRGSPW